MQEQEIMKFCDSITPVNWNFIVDNVGVIKDEPSILNIDIWLLSDEYLNDMEDAYSESDGESDEPFVGRVKGPLKFYPSGLLTSKPGKSYNMKTYKGPFTGFISMEFIKGWIGEDTLIHELAHVATVRAAAVWDKNRYKHGMVGQYIEGESMHGPLFQRAYETLISRAEKQYGSELVQHNKIDLEMYQTRTHGN